MKLRHRAQFTRLVDLVKIVRCWGIRISRCFYLRLGLMPVPLILCLENATPRQWPEWCRQLARGLVGTIMDVSGERASPQHDKTNEKNRSNYVWSIFGCAIGAVFIRVPWGYCRMSTLKRPHLAVHIYAIVFSRSEIQIYYSFKCTLTSITSGKSYAWCNRNSESWRHAHPIRSKGMLLYKSLTVIKLKGYWRFQHFHYSLKG